MSWIGGFTGFVVALGWALFGGALHSFAGTGLAAFFIAALGALVGWALTEVVVNLLLNRALLHSPPNEAPGERAREAEKFFYIGLLSAYQGKTRFALRMLALARSHGWRGWERLKNDPRLTPLARCAFERALIEPAGE